MTEPDAFIGFISIASDGEVPLKVGSFTKNTPGNISNFFLPGLTFVQKLA